MGQKAAFLAVGLVDTGRSVQDTRPCAAGLSCSYVFAKLEEAGPQQGHLMNINHGKIGE